MSLTGQMCKRFHRRMHTPNLELKALKRLFKTFVRFVAFLVKHLDDFLAVILVPTLLLCTVQLP